MHHRSKLNQRQRTSRNGGPYEDYGNAMSYERAIPGAYHGPRSVRNLVADYEMPPNPYEDWDDYEGYCGCDDGPDWGSWVRQLTWIKA